MFGNDLFFDVTPTAEEQLALARARVREQREGLKTSALLYGGGAVAGTAFAVAAHFSEGTVAILVPRVVILLVLPAAVLAIGAVSSLLRDGRRRHLIHSEGADQFERSLNTGDASLFRARRRGRPHRPKPGRRVA